MIVRRSDVLAVRGPQRGVTLVELIAFIVIVSIVATAMVQAFSGTMRGSDAGRELTQATQLAQQRMDVILGQIKSTRSASGYAGITSSNYDPCKSPVGSWTTAHVCDTTIYSGVSYSVNSSFNGASDACGAGTGTDCILITVTVTDPYNRLASSSPLTLTYQVWNY